MQLKSGECRIWGGEWVSEVGRWVMGRVGDGMIGRWRDGGMEGWSDEVMGRRAKGERRRAKGEGRRERLLVRDKPPRGLGSLVNSKCKSQNVKGQSAKY